MDGANTEPERDLPRPDHDDAFDRERSLKRVSAKLLGTPEEASRIGPFFVLERLGAGGMGVVYAGYDPRLDRKVAIKLLQPSDAQGEVDEEARERLLREARALAKLTHPNVVTVHEVGLHDDEVYVAMAFIEGQTLREWIDEGPHSIDDTLEILTAAGFGLAAAHDAGIIHRDFKPRNVLIGEDKTVCVADFGLARADASLDTAPEVESTDASEPPPTASTDVDLTRTGSILGTPRYMAPEQHAGQAVSPASDQFAFALTLYEALIGEFPLSSDLSALVASKASGDIPRPDKASSAERIPSWLAEAILRGLASDPQRRHPSMHELLAELDPPRPGRQRLLIGAGAAIVALAAVPLALGGERELAAPACSTVAAELDAVWSAPRSETIGAAFAGSEVRYGESVWDAVQPRLDDAAQRWRDARTRVCELAVSGVETDAVLTRRLECLDRAKLHLQSALELFEAADPTTIDRASVIIDAAPSPSGCLGSRLSFSREWTPTDPEVLERRQGAWVEIAGANALFWAGRYDEARIKMEAFAASRDIDADPFVASEYYALRSRLDRDTRDPMIRKSLAAAVRSGSETHMISRYMDMGNHALKRQRPDDAKLAVELGLAVAQRWAAFEQDDDFLTHETTRARAQLQDLLGQAHVALNESDQAQLAYETALQLYSDLENVDGIRAVTQNNLGELHRRQGRYPQAIELYEAAAKAMGSARGRGHPKVGAILSNRAAAKSEYGDLEGALQDMQEALDVLERGRKEGADFVALVRFNRGILLVQINQLEQARPMLEGARRSFAAMVAGPQGAFLPLADAGLAALAMQEGDEKSATQLIEGAYARIQGQPPNPLSGSVVTERANILLKLGRSQEALGSSDEALTILEASIGAEATPTAVAHTIRGHALSALRRDEDARASYERARAILDKIGNSLHPSLAEVHRGLAVVDERTGQTQPAASHRARVDEIVQAHPGLYVTPEKILRGGRLG